MAAVKFLVADDDCDKFFAAKNLHRDGEETLFLADSLSPRFRIRASSRSMRNPPIRRCNCNKCTSSRGREREREDPFSHCSRKMRRTFLLRDRKYISRSYEREETSAAFRCPFTSPTGITSFLRGSSILSPPKPIIFFFLLLFSFIIFFALLSFYLSGLCTHEPHGDPRKSGDPEMYVACDVFEALCRDTIGGSLLFVRVYRIHRAFSSCLLRNRFIIVIYISRRF